VYGLFARHAFTGFGPNHLFPDAVPSAVAVRGRRPSRLRERVRAECPRLPGIYGMVDARGELIYVGKAKELRARLMSYFRPNSREPKAGHILHETRLLAWEVGPSEFDALLRELELIRRWQPRFNVQGQPRRPRRVYVCLGRRPAPHVFLAGRPASTAQAVYGPVPAGRTAREAVRRVNDWFRLRDCPQAQTMVFADQQELFPVLRAPGCIRHEIGGCLAPCAAACTLSDYAAAARAARAFLDGADPSPVESLERDMNAAAAAMQFERAAALRDRWRPLHWLTRHLSRLREAGGHSFIYPVAGHDGTELCYLIRRGRVVAALRRPADDEGRRRAGAELAAALAPGRVVPGPLSLAETDGVLLVAGWFRRRPAERQRAITPEQFLAGSGQ
jgi:excinuclease ABC subunit C